MVVHSQTNSKAVHVINILRILRECGWLQDKFEFSSLQVLHNVNVKEHRDSNIKGSQSLIVGVGDYSGGIFNLDGTDYDIRHEPLIFDGSDLHFTKPFLGDRWTITLYLHQRYEELERKGLENCGAGISLS